jgi:hypothetical protein
MAQRELSALAYKSYLLHLLLAPDAPQLRALPILMTEAAAPGRLLETEAPRVRGVRRRRRGMAGGGGRTVGRAEPFRLINSRLIRPIRSPNYALRKWQRVAG